MRIPINVKSSFKERREDQFTGGPPSRVACASRLAAYLFVSKTNSFQNSRGKNERKELSGLVNRDFTSDLTVDRLC